ncbi:MAG: hypothetical protein D6719_05555 [Candidatus Dadabacteria bacterium]|nr:MAG: hypothetical protein D6719_05555 [Candidatus Dadabacteria bacterium]
MVRASDISALIAQAEDLLDSSKCQNVEEVVEKLADYVESFSSLEKALMNSAAEFQQHTTLLRELESKHALVLSLAEELKDNTSKELRDLKVRGRGIMAYLDILPQRISVLGKRKG